MTGMSHSVLVTTSRSISTLSVSKTNKCMCLGLLTKAEWEQPETKSYFFFFFFFQKNVFSDSETIFLTGEYFILKNLFVD